MKFNLNVLITSTSFQDTPGDHHNLLKKNDWNIDYARGPLKENEIINIIHKYDAVICGDDEYTKKVLKIGSSSKLKFISKYGVGLDKIDLNAASEFNISVINCPSINQRSVAEHTLALLLTFIKNIHLQYSSVKKYSWHRLISNDLNIYKIGILGLGAIGKEFSKICVGLGLDVLAFDIKKPDIFLSQNRKIHYTNDVKNIYKSCSVISLHMPLNSKTKHIIDFNVVKNELKCNPIIINTSRGQLVENTAIIYGLQKKIISAYLCDVLEDEPISKDNQLVNIDNVIITPHIASRTYQNVEKQAKMAINNLVKLINENNFNQ
jgi:D-3-phosphoglycerate dehydrogenase